MRFAEVLAKPVALRAPGDVAVPPDVPLAPTAEAQRSSSGNQHEDFAPLETNLMRDVIHRDAVSQGRLTTLVFVSTPSKPLSRKCSRLTSETFP